MKGKNYKQNKTGDSSPSFSEGPGRSASSLCLSEFSYISFVYNVQGFELDLARGIEKTTSIIFPD